MGEEEALFQSLYESQVQITGNWPLINVFLLLLLIIYFVIKFISLAIMIQQDRSFFTFVIWQRAPPHLGSIFCTYFQDPKYFFWQSTLPTPLLNYKLCLFFLICNYVLYTSACYQSIFAQIYTSACLFLFLLFVWNNSTILRCLSYFHLQIINKI